MTTSKQRPPELVWLLMNDMERAVWATAFVPGENSGLAPQFRPIASRE